MEFRGLKPDEIEVRIGSVSKTGATFLLYKDARCDMQLLDETVGSLNWKREHTRDNANCIVSIYDTEKKEWVSKEDTGTESFTEKEKGLASDSFKRACVNWGVGRELYTAPFIFVALETQQKSGGKGYELTYEGQKNAKLEVSDIEYDESDGARKISKLTIIDKKGTVVYNWKLGKATSRTTVKASAKKKTDDMSKVKQETYDRALWKNKVLELGTELGYTGSQMASEFDLTKETTVDEFKSVYTRLEEEKAKK